MVCFGTMKKSSSNINLFNINILKTLLSGLQSTEYDKPLV